MRGAFIHGNSSDEACRLGPLVQQSAGTRFSMSNTACRRSERWQDETGDVKCALGWVAAHAAEYQIDPTRISVTGFSAGGTLAMLTIRN